jgi:hypothetical protein
VTCAERLRRAWHCIMNGWRLGRSEIDQSICVPLSAQSVSGCDMSLNCITRCFEILAAHQDRALAHRRSPDESGTTCAILAVWWRACPAHLACWLA